MYLKIEDLQNNHACEEGIKYIERFYPNGAELIDIIRDRHISKEFLHWGRKSLPVSEEEIAAYHEVCGIVDSERVSESTLVVECLNVDGCKNIQSSSNVFGSEDVKTSTDVVDSKTVENSKQVFASSNIIDCERIYLCDNITSSFNICSSEDISKSSVVFQSKSVFASSFVIECEDAKVIYLCKNCKNIKNSLLSYGINNSEYCIFNKPVSKERFEQLVLNIPFAFSEFNFVKYWPEDLGSSTAPETQDEEKFTEGLTEELITWIKVLPEYDEDIYNKLFN